jgi:hypothetical protein
MASPKYRFTTFDLDSCLEMAKAVHDNGALLSSAELAAHLGYKSDNNGSFNTRLANARLFGLVTGPSSALTTTPRSLAILHPDYPVAAARARLEAFESVPLYKAVLDQYHGQPLPDETGMRNALTTRWEITPERAQMVLARMMDSAEQASLFRTAGNRSRMIRPTLPSGDGPPLHQTPPPHSEDHHGDAGGGGHDKNSGVRVNKVIDGALDMLPDERQWDEENLSLWLRFFEDALRIYYKIPRHPTPGSSNGAGTSRPQEEVVGT